MSVHKFTKKPITIEAFRWDGTLTGKQAAKEFVGPALGTDGNELVVVTNHGLAVCYSGDWIIKSPAGEFYPCTDAVMQATYDAVPEPQEAVLVEAPYDLPPVDSKPAGEVVGLADFIPASEDTDAIEVTVRSMPGGGSDDEETTGEHKPVEPPSE